MASARAWLRFRIGELLAVTITAGGMAQASAAEWYGYDLQPPGQSAAAAQDPSNQPFPSDDAGPGQAPDVRGDASPPLPRPADGDGQKKLQAAVNGAYKGVFYDNNFDYLCNPCYDGYHLGEELKRICIHDDRAILDIGGEYRARYHHEHNMRGLGLTGNDDDFLLHRTRLYANLQIGERVRLYGEYIDAESNYENFAPRPTEWNRSDVLNLFGDLTIFDTDCNGKLVGRVGRQELLYGDQRVISPLDWANTRRTFDGAKLMWTIDDWRVDGFWAKPVIVDPRNFDSPDDDQQFYGAYATYNGVKNHVFDFYWLGLQSDRALFPGTQEFTFQTVGSRWGATWDTWQTILEGAYQFGDYGATTHSAGFFTAGAGRKWDDRCWKPEAWIYYDWASGDETLGNGYYHLFPLAHKYLGFMDFFARSNIQDINLQFVCSPTPKLKALLWHHVFFLEDTDDVIYGVTGRPLVSTAGGDRYLGQELDLLFTYQITPRSDIAFGYSHFFTGTWYRTNPDASTGFTGDADFFYTQFTARF